MKQGSHGQRISLKLSQRGPDAGQEVLMRTPKPFYAHERVMYHPELLTCPHCGDLLVTCNSLAWDKTVQMLDRVLSVASRPGHCPHATCIGSRLPAPPMATTSSSTWAGGGRSPAPRTVRCMRHWPPGSASQRPLWAICINRFLCPSWPATSGSTASASPRLPSSRAA
jgi:hypothetical protein